MRFLARNDLGSWSAALAVFALVLQTALFGFLTSDDAMAAEMAAAGFHDAGNPAPSPAGGHDAMPCCMLACACASAVLDGDHPPEMPWVVWPVQRVIATLRPQDAISAAAFAPTGLQPARGPPPLA